MTVYSTNRWFRSALIRFSMLGFSLFASIGLSISNLRRAHAQDAAPASTDTSAKPAPVLSLYPLDSVVDKQGRVFTVDRNLPGIWKWQADKLSLFVQGPKQYRQPLNAIRCIALDHEGKLLVGDSATRDVYRISEDGRATAITGGQIGTPMDIAVKSDGTIYVADLELRKLMRIPVGSTKVEHVADVNPRGVFVDSADKVWVVSQDVQQLLVVADDGTKEVVVDKRVFEFPHQVVVNSKGEAFVSDGYKKAIWKVVRGQAPSIVVEGLPLDNPVGLALYEDQVIVTDPRASKVMKLTPENKIEVWFEVKR